ncbi:MAG: helix-turn-helix domain-containing protein, partial [Nitrospirota bacterium]
GSRVVDRQGGVDEVQYNKKCNHCPIIQQSHIISAPPQQSANWYLLWPTKGGGAQMKRSATQLTEAERYHLYTMQKQHKPLREIAKGMGRSPTTLSRELRRSTGLKGYRYQQAPHKASL